MDGTLIATARRPQHGHGHGRSSVGRADGCHENEPMSGGFRAPLSLPCNARGGPEKTRTSWKSLSRASKAELSNAASSPFLPSAISRYASGLFVTAG